MPNETRTATPLDNFLFDLRGYLVLKNAVAPDLIARLNDEFDEFPRDLEIGDWYRGSQRRDYNKKTGLELHHCLEIGGPFEELIDHPSWLELVRHYCGEENSYVAGLFIDECLASTRQSGGDHVIHSGGFQGAMRGAYRYNNGAFRCGQCNILLALTDIGADDGATMVVPGSHKSNFPLPPGADLSELAEKVFLEKGDALLFCDGVMHGGSERTNSKGERRVIIYRYGPAWGATRFGYQYSPELLERLTPQRRLILQPVPPCRPGDNFIPDEAPHVARKVLAAAAK